MIEIAESWPSIFQRIGAALLKRGRGGCPFCESSTGFSAHEQKGFHCFACGAHGDKIGFIRQFYKCDFKSALRFFGLEPGKPPTPDPELIRQRRIREGLELWAKTEARKLRADFLRREKLETVALEILAQDSDDLRGWMILADALLGKEAIEYELDLLETGTPEEQRQIYRSWRTAA